MAEKFLPLSLSLSLFNLRKRGKRERRKEIISSTRETDVNDAHGIAAPFN